MGAGIQTFQNGIVIGAVSLSDTQPYAVIGSGIITNPQTNISYLYLTPGRALALQLDTAFAGSPSFATDALDVSLISTIQLMFNIDSGSGGALRVDIAIQSKFAGSWCDIVNIPTLLVASTGIRSWSIGPGCEYPRELGYNIRVNVTLNAGTLDGRLEVWGKS